MKKTILIVAAHPDDEILGCGGTMARMVRDGNRICTLILGEGITSRDAKRNAQKRGQDIRALKKQTEKANRLVGVKEVFVHDFPDNRFDSVPLLDIIKVVEKVVKEVKPDIIFTHHRRDLNVDHRITFNTVLTASRPVEGNSVKELYSFEVPSSTEWNAVSSFSPDIFFDISDTLQAKVCALKAYAGELRDFPHPRSVKGVQMRAGYWGMHVGKKAAEAFEVIRVLK